MFVCHAVDEVLGIVSCDLPEGGDERIGVSEEYSIDNAGPYQPERRGRATGEGLDEKIHAAHPR
jgi:hypothetical protein